ncbi:hypothetical protein KSP40_PGU003497 [Platanthera guangdongensis]|uniref:Uncharacterized protein n=1 Tax=Platanthera guangdongensis TaxID=2320717 RepID=A0ABR2MR61_9ASPA
MSRLSINAVRKLDMLKVYFSSDHNFQICITFATRTMISCFYFAVLSSGFVKDLVSRHMEYSRSSLTDLLYG